ncbi:hypothetical protein FNV43_RR02445 [Rhamnella rubrinervis]|uniref:Uncharacterized protein n=1 Tax=Rhamnella rubrinervis TaxID=2594499 RepID=A0A8K0HRH6_9ROSA|nr:hypothetical protein FNV43_RR02445 [Rhamnella rubrinervis]
MHTNLISGGSSDVSNYNAKGSLGHYQLDMIEEIWRKARLMKIESIEETLERIDIQSEVERGKEILSGSEHREDEIYEEPQTQETEDIEDGFNNERTSTIFQAERID